MPEISKREKRLDWICRILLSINLYVVIAGYITYFQTSYQLVSPLIPQSTVYKITDSYMKSSLAVSIFFLVGIWLYSFNKKIAAIISFALGVLSYDIFFYFIQKVSSS